MLRFCMLVVSCFSLLAFSPAPIEARPALSPTCRDLLQRMERTMQEAARSPLQGAWAGSHGRDSLVLIFAQNVCAMGMNNEELYGFWSTHGNTLKLTLERNKVFEFHYVLSGQTLTLDRDIVLTRQNGVVRDTIPGFGDSMAPAGRGKRTPLEGSWESRTDQGPARFVFTGSEYAFFLRGRQVESGSFNFRNGFLSYTIKSGNGVGRQGEHRATLRGNVLTIVNANGTEMQFVRK